MQTCDTFALSKSAASCLLRSVGSCACCFFVFKSFTTEGPSFKQIVSAVYVYRSAPKLPAGGRLGSSYVRCQCGSLEVVKVRGMLHDLLRLLLRFLYDLLDIHFIYIFFLVVFLLFFFFLVWLCLSRSFRRNSVSCSFIIMLCCLFVCLHFCQIYTLLTHTSSMNFMLWLKATQEKRLLLLRVNFRVELGERTTSVVTCLVRI